jgi:hypothetical protein
MILLLILIKPGRFLRFSASSGGIKIKSMIMIKTRHGKLDPLLQNGR